MSKESATALLTGTPGAPAGTPEQTATPAGSPGLQAAPELESTRFTHLAKKEAELQRQREGFKKEQETLKQERDQSAPGLKRLTEFEEMRKTDPVAAMKYLGFSDTDLFNFMAASEDTSTPEQKAAKAAQAEIQKFTDAQAKKEQEASQKRDADVIQRFRQDIAKQVASDKDKYEYCNYQGALAEELIYSTVDAVLAESKELISVQEATDMVESYYEEQDKSMNTLKKRQPKPAEQQQQDAPIKEAPLRAEVSARPASKTLSSRTAATVASTTIPKKETRDEKRDRLVAKLANMGKQ